MSVPPDRIFIVEAHGGDQLCDDPNAARAAGYVVREYVPAVLPPTHAPELPLVDTDGMEKILRRHMAMYDWTKKESLAINDFILSVREGLAEELQPIPHKLLRRGDAEFCECGVYWPDVKDGIADHKGECRALDFQKALRLLALGADDTYGWNTAHLEEAQRLLERYPRAVTELHEAGLAPVGGPPEGPAVPE